MRTVRLLILCLAAAATVAAERLTVTLLVTTDLHGNIYPHDYYTGKSAQRGLAKIATLVEEARWDNPNSLLIDCGDTIQGSPLESVYQHYVRAGRLPLNLTFASEPLRLDPMMLAMNFLGYDAMVLGNHEFNFGLRNLERARSEANFPWISANTAAEPGAPVRPFEPYIVKAVAGVKVGVIGITTPAVPSWEPPENYQGYRFLPGRQAVESALAELRRKHRPEVVVVAAHAALGGDGDRGRRQRGPPGENTVYEIATGVPGIDAIVYGHSHRQQEGLRIGDVLLVQPRNWGISLGRVDLVLDNSTGGAWTVVEKQSRLIPVSKQTAPHPEILRLARPYHELTEQYLDTPVAHSAVAVDGRLGRIKDSALVDAIHEAQLHYAKADVSFTALFNPRVSIAAGPVTVRQIAALYVYDNELYAIEGNGRMVKRALENAARYYLSCRDALCANGPLINQQVNGFNYDMAGGVEYEIDLTKPPGRRVRNLRWKGLPLRPSQKLRIAVNSYRAGGSAGYGMFRDARILWRSNEDIRSLVVAYYIERQELPAQPDGNWRIVPPAALETLEREILGESERLP